MRKDEFIEEQFDAYVRGTEEPQVDLSAAKRALTEERKRRARKRRALVSALSACACVLLVSVLTVVLLPKRNSTGDALPSEGAAGGTQREFSLSEASARAMGVGELSKTYGSLNKLSALALSSDCSAVYTVYSVEGEAALLRTELLFCREGRRVQAVVWTDLSGGALRAEELGEYDSLSQAAAGYRYETDTVAGEYLSRGSFTADGTEFFVEVQSSLASAFPFLMNYLM